MASHREKEALFDRKTHYEFRQCPEGVTIRDDISVGAKGLYAYILLIEDPEFLTIKGICIQLKENEEAVKKMMQQLEACGHVSDVR